MKATDHEIAIALEAWLDETKSIINEQLYDLTQLIGFPRWYALPSGGFKHFPYTAMYKPFLLEEAIFQNNPKWPEVKRLAYNHGNLRTHFSRFFQTASGSGRSFSLEELSKLLLPKLGLNGEHSIFADAEFESTPRVREFLEAINSDSVQQLTIWPIRGLVTEGPVVLDKFTEFRELNVEEKLQCLNFGIIRPHILQELVPERSCWFGLCRTTNDQKIFDDDAEPDFQAFENRMADQEQVLEDFLVAVPLTNGRVAFHAGGFGSAPHFETGNILAFTIGRQGGTTNDHLFMNYDNGTRLNSEDAIELQEMWSFIRGRQQGPFHKRVRNAARRLFYAETRSKPEDVIIDLMIAAESLYLSTEKDELSYRMSLNAALWADLGGSEKREVVAIFKKAYNLRSKVVHGSAAIQAKIIESNNEIKPILSDGIRKAMHYLNENAEAPDWESMIFPNLDS
ncbi:MAG: hypothetical protein ACK5WH_07600 [Hyphomonadaceae bacterium]|jgi:hypothetical protein